jgi:threonine/homoserine/homoserine lactone efflux protein
MIRLDGNLGLIGPSAWFVSTMLSQMLPQRDCTSGHRDLLIGTALCLLVGLLGVALSIRAKPHYEHTERFSVRISGIINIAFCVVMVMQAAAIAIIDPCLR